MDIFHQVPYPFLVEGPVRDIPPFLPVLFPVICHQVMVVKPVQNIPDLMNISLYFFSNLEVRNILLVLKELNYLDGVFSYDFLYSFINLGVCDSHLSLFASKKSPVKAPQEKRGDQNSKVPLRRLI